ncbi:MAG: hypothetical protein LBT25_01045 [Candidatus Symbiothrix sp.]|nr:hypothetical protein [Candidatus Symbiothrix sp.]
MDTGVYFHRYIVNDGSGGRNIRGIGNCGCTGQVDYTFSPIPDCIIPVVCGYHPNRQ